MHTGIADYRIQHFRPSKVMSDSNFSKTLDTMYIELSIFEDSGIKDLITQFLKSF